MATNKQYARKVDYEKSASWALSSLGSLGLGYVGVQLFHLVNRITHRGHRFELFTVGGGKSPVPFTGSVGSSDYASFHTRKPVNFFDFDGMFAKVSEINAGLYSWTSVEFPSLFLKVGIADGGLNVPSAGEGGGLVEILFGDGKILGQIDDLQVKPPVDNRSEPKPFKKHSPNDASTYILPGDLLFAFDKYRLKPGRRTEEALDRIANQMNYQNDDFRFLIIGHTDNKGNSDYNLRLSKNRADTVANWFKTHTKHPSWIKPVGVGLSEPIASNASEQGRSENRRVEVVVIRKKYWESA